MTEDKSLNGTALSIGEVAHKTGLTERALRYYESEGLLTPIRSENGRRAYRNHDLATLAQIQLLRKAGFTVSQIRILLNERTDLPGLIGTRIEILNNDIRRLHTSVALLSSVNEKLNDGIDIDALTLCELIKDGETEMQHDQWQKVYDKYYSKEEQEEWKKAKEKNFKNIDHDEYGRKWEDLAKRIADALPLDPASDKAQGFLAEWNQLLEPFMQNASPDMVKNAGRLYENVDEWGDSVNSPITPEIWAFIKAAGENITV